MKIIILNIFLFFFFCNICVLILAINLVLFEEFRRVEWYIPIFYETTHTYEICKSYTVLNTNITGRKPKRYCIVMTLLYGRLKVRDDDGKRHYNTVIVFVAFVARDIIQFVTCDTTRIQLSANHYCCYHYYYGSYCYRCWCCYYHNIITTVIVTYVCPVHKRRMNRGVSATDVYGRSKIFIYRYTYVCSQRLRTDAETLSGRTIEERKIINTTDR